MPTEPKKLTTIGFRANDAEREVFDRFYRRIQQRNPYISASDILRELVMIRNAVITEEDRTWLREQFRVINADDHPGDDARPLTPGHG